MVPNKHPAGNFNGLAIIGEAPGADEEYAGEPFVGVSGRFLKAALRLAGIDPNACFYGNICQHRPPNNDIAAFNPQGEEFLAGLEQLAGDLRRNNPTTILLLGNTALRQFYPGLCSVSTHRGTLFLASSSSPCPGTKALSTYHPAGVLRTYDWAPLLLFDITRAASELLSPRLDLPERRIFVGADFTHLCCELQRCLDERVKLSPDIEGGVDGIKCIGFARSPSDAFVVPFRGPDGRPCWTEDEECVLWRLIGQVLEDIRIPKVLQNSLYDNFVLAFVYRILIRNVVDDTMLKHWEAFCELDKNLGLQTSIYTREPYYKQERKDADIRTFWTYCGKDCCVTHEIDTVLDGELAGNPTGRVHYNLNINLLPAFLYMELSGIRYNTDRAKKRRGEVLSKLHRAQFQIDTLAHRAVDPATESIFALLTTTALRCCTARSQKHGFFTPDDVVTNLLGPFKDHAPRLKTLLATYPYWSDEDNGEFCTITDRGMNIRGGDFKDWFYKMISEVPVKNRKTGETTTDYETVLRLAKKTKNPLCKYVLEVADHRTHEGMLAITADPDGRVRCGYNLVGTVTGRITCYTSPTGSGYNLQTIPEYDRDLFLADEGYEIFQCDLSGADAWTVAAHCKAAGDSTMLDDLVYGIKIAKVIACMFTHGDTISTLSRAELKTLTDTIKKEDPIYFASKCCQHGTNLGMGAETMSFTAFKMSDGAVDVPTAVCKVLSRLYLQRYWGIGRWHARVQHWIKTDKKITSASGHTRVIMGRPDDHETFKGAVADEPQNNTTYATNKAAYNCWVDPENRNPDGSLIIKPLHQVHDAFMGQWPIIKRDWAINKLRQYFNNKITIAGTTLAIPFEGAYGPSWGEKIGTFK